MIPDCGAELLIAFDDLHEFQHPGPDLRQVIRAPPRPELDIVSEVVPDKLDLAHVGPGVTHADLVQRELAVRVDLLLREEILARLVVVNPPDAVGANRESVHVSLDLNRAFKIERKGKESLDGDGVITIERLVSRVVIGQAALAEGSIRRWLVVRAREPHALRPLPLPEVTEGRDQLLERQPAAPHELLIERLQGFVDTAAHEELDRLRLVRGLDAIQIVVAVLTRARLVQRQPAMRVGGHCDLPCHGSGA